MAHREELVVHIKPRESSPINMDISAEKLIQQVGTSWDIIYADPPWNIAKKDPTRGVSLPYDTKEVGEIFDMGWTELTQNGLVFLWVVQRTLFRSIREMEHRGFTLLEEVVWCKYNDFGKIAKSYGHFFQRGKEHCLIFKKGNPRMRGVTLIRDVIHARRREVSQKPQWVYEVAEAVMPGSRKIEIFARNNNLSPGWTSVGNQVSTAGVMLSDENAL